MEGKKKWRITGKNGETVYDVIKEALRDAWGLYNNARGVQSVIYVADVDPEKRTIVLGTDIVTPSTEYRWTRDYNSPSTIIARYDPVATWDWEEIGPAEEPGKIWVDGELLDEEEFLDIYTSEMASDAVEDVTEEAIRTAEEILRYEAAE